jgi:hypothetical protein
MKLNLVNKFYIGVAILLFIAVVCRFVSFKSWVRYNYSASAVAPSTFPVHVREAYFIIPGDEMQGVEHQSLDYFNTDWNTDYTSVNHARLQRLPEKLVLKYVSYRDAKFYSDTLDLPQAEIKSIFKSASANKQFLVLSSFAGERKGLSFVIGLANGGNIIVWLRGVNLEKTVLKAKLKSKEPRADETYYEKQFSKKEYFKLVFEDLADSIKTKLNNGFDAGANYIDTPTRYIENNKELWIYQKKNGFID